MFGISLIDIAVIIVYVSLIFWLGWRAKKQVATSGDYFMGNRRGSKLMMIANAIGAGTHTNQAILVSGATYQLGLAGIWYQWFFIFATPFFWIIAPIYRRLRYVTLGDFFEERFGSKTASAYTIMGLIWFTLNVGLILKGTGTAIESITGGALSSAEIVIALTVFFLSYSVLGGFVSALFVNLLQGVFVVVLSFLVIPFALNAGGGITAIRAKLPESMFSFIAPHEVTLFLIIMIVINGLIGVAVEPHHMAIGGSGKSEMNCRTGWTYGNFVKRIATLGWAFIGVFAAALYPGLTSANREQAFGLAVVNLLPSGLIGLMIAAMSAMVLGACHNYMVGGSALFTKNLYQKFSSVVHSDKQYLKVGRVSSLLIVIGGVTIALTLSSVLQGIKYLWQITAFFGIAFWVGIMWRRANRYGVFASVISSLSAAVITGPFILNWEYQYQIALYLPVGFLAMIFVSLLTPPEPEKQLNKFYTLLHTPVGEEYRLKDQGIEMMLEGESVRSGNNAENKISQEEEGHSLLFVDFLSLPRKFSFKKYKVDVIGFAFAVLFVLGILGIGFYTAGIGK
ncbi:MAG: sodium:solute symporter family protein [Bacteroidota bacterium]